MRSESNVRVMSNEVNVIQMFIHYGWVQNFPWTCFYGFFYIYKCIFLLFLEDKLSYILVFNPYKHFHVESEYWGKMYKITSFKPNELYMYRREKNEVRKRDASLDGKKSGRLYVLGKNLKNHWRAQRKWGREKKGETSQKQGRNQWKRRSEEMNKGEKKAVGRTEWKITVLAWGNVKNAGQCVLGKRMGTGQDKEQSDDNLTEHRSNGAAEGVLHAGRAWF